MSRTLHRVVTIAIIFILFVTSCNFLPTPSRFPQLNEQRISSIGRYEIPVRWSPDGHYLAYQDLNTEDVIIHDLTTGQRWNVGEHVLHPDSPIHNFAWHPTGRISYLKWRYAPEGTSLDGVEELHLADVDGQNDTIIVDNLPFGVDYLWFPDGQRLIMRWAAKPSNYPIDDVYIVDVDTGQRETLVSYKDLNLGIISMVLLPDEDILLLNGIRELESGQAGYFILYDLTQRRVVQEIHLDPLFASGRLPDYPNLRPHIGNFSLNYVKPGKDRWIIGDFWAPAGECYNYAVYFFNLDDVSRNFCISSEEGPTGDISVAPDVARIAYTPTDAPGRVWVMVADLTPEIRERLEH
jgi:hypothetical protein